MLRTVKQSRLNDHVDRRRFVTAVTVGFATQLALSSEEAAAQTARPNSASSTRPLPPDSGLFKGFEAKWVRTNGADIFLRHGGEGPPLLLLHGNPQTHACFHKIAATLAQRFHVVAADLRWLRRQRRPQ